jgi:hypothetical protein
MAARVYLPLVVNAILLAQKVITRKKGYQRVALFMLILPTSIIWVLKAILQSFLQSKNSISPWSLYLWYATRRASPHLYCWQLYTAGCSTPCFGIWLFYRCYKWLPCRPRVRLPRSLATTSVALTLLYSAATLGQTLGLPHLSAYCSQRIYTAACSYAC